MPYDSSLSYKLQTHVSRSKNKASAGYTFDSLPLTTTATPTFGVERPQAKPQAKQHSQLQATEFLSKSCSLSISTATTTSPSFDELAAPRRFARAFSLPPRIVAVPATVCAPTEKAHNSLNQNTPSDSLVSFEKDYHLVPSQSLVADQNASNSSGFNDVREEWDYAIKMVPKHEHLSFKQQQALGRADSTAASNEEELLLNCSPQNISVNDATSTESAASAAFTWLVRNETGGRTSWKLASRVS